MEIKEGGIDETPVCEHCQNEPAIHAIANNTGGFNGYCHKCYTELTSPVTRSELKGIIKEAIKEYDSGNTKN